MIDWLKFMIRFIIWECSYQRSNEQVLLVLSRSRRTKLTSCRYSDCSSQCLSPREEIGWSITRKCIKHLPTIDCLTTTKSPLRGRPSISSSSESSITSSWRSWYNSAVYSTQDWLLAACRSSTSPRNLGTSDVESTPMANNISPKTSWSIWRATCQKMPTVLWASLWRISTQEKTGISCMGGPSTRRESAYSRFSDGMMPSQRSRPKRSIGSSFCIPPSGQWSTKSATCSASPIACIIAVWWTGSTILKRIIGILCNSVLSATGRFGPI